MLSYCLKCRKHRDSKNSESVKTKYRSSDILIKELQDTSYDLISLEVAFNAEVTGYELFLLHELRATFCIRVTS